MREFLRGLDFDSETIDVIMSEYGKYVTKDKEKITELEGEIYELKKNSNVDWKEKFETLDNQIKEQESQRKAKEEDDNLTKNITQAIGNRRFVNDFTKNAIVNEIKTALKDSANAGKSAKDLFVEITKDKEGIFSNPNQQIDMPGIDETIDTGNISKAEFDKMGYKERLELKQNNPELFRKYNNN